jgi:hypothetical protein
VADPAEHFLVGHIFPPGYHLFYAPIQVLIIWHNSYLSKIILKVVSTPQIRLRGPAKPDYISKI